MENTDSLSNDLSFVILGSDSLSAESLVLPEPASIFQSTLNLSTDFNSTIDVQQKLDQLLKENKDLKNALNQNNLAMKTQFETLADWQQEVLLTHQNHKQKFSETREMVLKLKTENTQLKNELDGRSILKSREDTLDSIHSEHGKNEKLKAENLILVKERDAFREECTRLTVKISNLESVIRNKSEEIEVLKSTCGSLLMEDSRQPRDTLRSGAGQSQSVIEKYSLQSWADLPETPSKIHNPTLQDVNLLKSSLEEETVKTSRVRAELVKVQEQLNAEVNLRKDTHELLKKKSDEVLEVQRVLSVKEKLLDAAIADLHEEKQRNRQLTLDSEQLAVLKTQVELYETDFKVERAARETLAGEKETLAKEKRELQRVIDEFKAKEVNLTPDSDVAAANIDDADIKFVCFKCEKAFSHLSQLENHVEQCLELQ